MLPMNPGPWRGHVLPTRTLTLLLIILLLSGHVHMTHASVFSLSKMSDVLYGNSSTIFLLDLRLSLTTGATASFWCNQPEFTFSPTTLTGHGLVTIGHAGFEGLADIVISVSDAESVGNSTVRLFVDKPAGDTTTSKILHAKADSCSPGGSPATQVHFALGHQSVEASATSTIYLKLVYTICPASFDLAPGGLGLCSVGGDVNECALNTHNCDAQAACTNTDGSFTCACNAGYGGAGTSGTCSCDSTMVITVTTFAGSGTAGTIDATGASASFTNPWGVVFDAAGHMYIGGWLNHKIRKISPAGDVTTFAGCAGVCTVGAVDGSAASASFYSPGGVALDAADHLYVADKDNHVVRKVSPAGVVTTFAGTGTAGAIDATGTSASFDQPWDVEVDTAGHVYVAEGGNHKIRKISPAGVVTTFAGCAGVCTAGAVDGSSTSASFFQPVGLALDATGHLYVADFQNHRIRKISPAGVVTTFAGSGTAGAIDATGTSASFLRPRGIAVDAAGHVYTTSVNHKIRKISPAGVVTTLAGTGSIGAANGAGSSATFNYPADLEVDAHGNVWVVDSANHRIRKIVQSCLA